jgi:osmoprotectant transport system ATP-binding protein
MNAIRFVHVNKVYPGAAAPAVDDVTLDVPAGKTVVILGTSGSGKTTLLKMVNRLYEPTSGQILVEGTEIHDLPINDLRRRIGYVIQQIGLFPHWTVAQNVATVPHVLRWDEKRVQARVTELLETVGLPPAEYRNRYPSQLSGGQQQRVGIARALAADPDIMLMDEPFGAVDAITRARLQEEFLTLQQRTHKTVLFVTHDVEEALHLADKLIVMDGGHVLQYDTSFNVITHPANDFVSQLLGAGNVMHLLSLVSVKNVLEPWLGECSQDAPPLHIDQSMSDVLATLLRAGCDVLPVNDRTGQRVGQVSLATVRQRLRQPTSFEDGHA